jgi:hypothetical protein
MNNGKLKGPEKKPFQIMRKHKLQECKSRILLYLHTIILPVVLYGCETWSLTLREEYKLGVSENRVLRRISGLARDEVTGCWGKLHYEKHHNF